jgi:hypothetical protein
MTAGLERVFGSTAASVLIGLGIEAPSDLELWIDEEQQGDVERIKEACALGNEGRILRVWGRLISRVECTFSLRGDRLIREVSEKWPHVELLYAPSHPSQALLSFRAGGGAEVLSRHLLQELGLRGILPPAWHGALRELGRAVDGTFQCVPRGRALEELRTPERKQYYATLSDEDYWKAGLAALLLGHPHLNEAALIVEEGKLRFRNAEGAFIPDNRAVQGALQSLTPFQGALLQFPHADSPLPSDLRDAMSNWKALCISCQNRYAPALPYLRKAALIERLERIETALAQEPLTFRTLVSAVFPSYTLMRRMHLAVHPKATDADVGAYSFDQLYPLCPEELRRLVDQNNIIPQG